MADISFPRSVQVAMMTGFLLLLINASMVMAACDKCGSLPPTDCRVGQVAPVDGGPTCTCNAAAPLRGCILKPCDKVPGDEICDCSKSVGSLPQRQICYSYQCTGGNGDCESCHKLPPDCTMHSYTNAPAHGGPPCSCANQMAPAGCTLKTCTKSKSFSPDPCICQQGVGSIFCFDATCPGNRNSESGAITVQPINLLIAVVLTCYYFG